MINCAADMSQYHYNVGFQDGYMACEKEFTEKAEIKRKQKMEEREKALYFLKQRFIGIFVLILTIVSVWALEGDATMGLFTVPLGIALLFSKKPIIYGKYFWKMEEQDK